MPRDTILVHLLLRVLGEHLGQQPQDVQILEDVRLFVGDQEQVHGALVQGLVHVPHVLRLHVRMLLARPDEFGERREQTLDADARHGHELAGDQGCGEEVNRGRVSTTLAFRD